MITKETVKRLNDLKWKVERHPAKSPFYNADGVIEWALTEVCKHGRSDVSDVLVFYTKSSYRKYKDLFDEEKKECGDTDWRFIRIYVPYERFFGHPWKFDHVEYWGEIPFSVFTGKITKKPSYNFKEWCSCQLHSCSDRTFEGLCIKLYREFLRRMGRFECDDFLTKEERENHRTTPIFTKKVERRYKSNPTYIHVSDEVYNRRWLKWFLKTPYGKKNWASSFESLI